jgi:hypothetical protein
MQQSKGVVDHIFKRLLQLLGLFFIGAAIIAVLVVRLRRELGYVSLAE